MARAREGIDWLALHREGMHPAAGLRREDGASVFVAPFDATRECVVLIMPCDRALTERLRAVVIDLAALVSSAGGFWAWARAIGRRNDGMARIVLAVVGFGLVLTVAAGGLAQPVAPPAPMLPATIDQWTAIVGVLLPLLIAVVNRKAWGSPLKAAAALGLCLVAAAGDVWAKGQWSAGAWGQNALAIFFLVVTTYHGFWKPTGLAEAVERRTG